MSKGALAFEKQESTEIPAWECLESLATNIFFRWV